MDDTDLILQCRKCYHMLYVQDVSLEKLLSAMRKDCPSCGEEGQENWILYGIGNFNRDFEDFED